MSESEWIEVEPVDELAIEAAMDYCETCGKFADGDSCPACGDEDDGGPERFNAIVRRVHP